MKVEYHPAPAQTSKLWSKQKIGKSLELIAGLPPPDMLLENKKELQSDLIKKWVQENPPGEGNGWEPYPISLRIVNWVKWDLAKNCLSDEALHSLAVQARYLLKRPEFHLLGNHLFANAKALIFAGLFFYGIGNCP